MVILTSLYNMLGLIWMGPWIFDFIFILQWKSLLSIILDHMSSEFWFAYFFVIVKVGYLYSFDHVFTSVKNHVIVAFSAAVSMAYLCSFWLDYDFSLTASRVTRGTSKSMIRRSVFWESRRWRVRITWRWRRIRWRLKAWSPKCWLPTSPSKPPLLR